MGSFEGRILPSMPTHEGITKLGDLKIAMKKFSEHTQPTGTPKPFSWSRPWLADIGHDEHDVVALMLFASYWMNTFATVGKMMQDFRPVLDDSN